MGFFSRKPQERQKPRETPAKKTDIGRNDPCHCGSGKKYKKCHEEKDAAAKHTLLEKQWQEAEKEAAKKADSQTADSRGAGNPTSANPSPANPSPANPKSANPSFKHNPRAIPKFNMPRRIGGV